MSPNLTPELVGVQRIPDVTERPAAQQPRGQINTPIFPADDLKAHGRLPITPEIIDTVSEVIALLVGMGPSKPHVIKCTEDGKLIVDVEAIVADHVNVDTMPQVNAELVDAAGGALKVDERFGDRVLASLLYDQSSALFASIINMPNVNATGLWVQPSNAQAEGGVYSGLYAVVRPKASTPKSQSALHAASSLVLPAAGGGLRNVLTGLYVYVYGTGAVPTQGSPVALTVSDGATVVFQANLIALSTTEPSGFVALPVGGIVGTPNTALTIAVSDPGANNTTIINAMSYTA